MNRGPFWLQKIYIVKLHDRALSSVPNHKHQPLSVWRKCEILGAINRIASLVFRHDPERNEWRIVFKLIKATEEWRRRSAGTHMSDLNSTPPGIFELYSWFRKNAVFGVST